MPDTTEPRVNAKKIYLKDASLESPGSPAIFLAAAPNPEIDMNINISNTKLDQEGKFYEVVLQVTTTATHDGDTLFVAEVKDAGIFEVNVASDEQRELILQIGCPHMLLPFAREEIANLVAKAGFPQLLISPINFEKIYYQRIAKEKESKAAAESGQTH